MKLRRDREGAFANVFVNGIETVNWEDQDDGEKWCGRNDHADAGGREKRLSIEIVTRCDDCAISADPRVFVAVL